MTNIIENLYSQRRDKISYLVRCSKAHAKSFIWLDNRLARFFVNKNIGKYWALKNKKLFGQCLSYKLLPYLKNLCYNCNRVCARSSAG